jgi:hypothetical protein
MSGCTETTRSGANLSKAAAKERATIAPYAANIGLCTKPGADATKLRRHSQGYFTRKL